MENRFTCYVIGEGTLAIQCAEYLKSIGHHLLGIISPDQQIHDWALKQEIKCGLPDSLDMFLKETEFDYLFSVVNNTYLSQEILDLPKQLAINYHDALLPKYAGINATTWALINQEQQHGISWHVMTNEIDAGDLLIQREVTIDPEETVFTLNGKCYEQAIIAFKTLVAKLSIGQIQLIEQNQSKRSYFARFDKPKNCSIINWNESASTISAQYRALQFEGYLNEVALPKILMGKQCIVPQKLRILPTKSTQLPGTICQLNNQKLIIATADYDVEISAATSMFGKVLDQEDYLSQYQLSPGYRLNLIDKYWSTEITKFHQMIARDEPKWVQRLLNYTPIEIPGTIAKIKSSKNTELFNRNDTINKSKIPQKGIKKVDLSDQISSKNHTDNELNCDYIISVFSTYLAKLTDIGIFNLGLCYSHVKKQFGSLFSNQVPFRIDVNLNNHFSIEYHNILNTLNRLKSASTFTNDVFLRYPELKSDPEFEYGFQPKVSIELVQTLSDTFNDTLGTIPADLLFRISEKGDVVEWIYDTQIYTPELIERLNTQFLIFLRQVQQNSHLSLANISIMSDSEKNHILYDFNQTQVSYPNHLCLHHLFEQQAIKTPDALAVRFNNKDLSYQEFEQQTNQLANQLITMGIGPNKVVGVCMHRSMEMVIALYAILKAGGAYLPLDPDYPENRLQFMLDDAQAKVVLSQEPIAQGFSLKNCSVLCLDSQWEQVAKHSAAQPLSRVTVNDLAYIIYTSGSTGQPKGVMIGHQAIVNRINWMQEEFQLDASDSVLQKTPFSFDVSVWEFFWPLAVGASLVVAKPEGHKDSRYLIKTIQDNRITTLHFVPSMLNVFLDDAQVGECQGLKRVICSGEALAYEYQQRFFNCFEQTELYNLYGPTEAAVDVTAWRCERNTNSRIVPIGYAIANTQIHILDKQLQPVPVGVPGELHIGGVQLAQGYLNRPELTAEKFIPNPISQNPADRLYKTSDLARYLPDGAIEYLGRIDHQVKIRGLRIELGEIEAVLAQHPVITECVVIVREDMPGDKRIVAYVVTDQQQRPKVSELHQHLKQQLPEYMLPTAFVFLATIPLSKNGKIDRKALPIPDQVRPELDNEYVSATTEDEQKLVEIWQNNLGIEQIGITDNFFELGGDSIRIIQIIAQAKAVNISLNIQQFFKHRTIKNLLQNTKNKTNIDKTESIPAFSLISPQEKTLLPDDIVDAFPMSTLQKGFVFHSEHHPDAYFYQVVYSFKIQAKFEIEAFQKAVNELIQRHAMLRTSFNLGDFSEPMQLVHNKAENTVKVEDIRHLNEEQQNDYIEKSIVSEEHTSFVWDNPPLLRFIVHQRSENSFQFGASFHDAIMDGWSASNMVVELFKRYVGHLNKAEQLSIKAPSNLTYSDFVASENKIIASNQAKQYWHTLLDNCPFNQLPRHPETNQLQKLERNLDYEVPVSEALFSALLKLAKSTGVSVKSVLLAAHCRLLGLLSGQNDVLTGLVCNGRLEEAGSEKMLGNYLNTMPFRTQLLDQGDSWVELIRRIFKSELDMLPHRRYASAHLQTEWGGKPLFEVVFNYINFHVYDELDQLEGIKFLGGKITDPFHYPLAVTFRVNSWGIHGSAALHDEDQGIINPHSGQKADKLLVVLNYNNMLTHEQVKTIGEYYTIILNQIVNQPDASYLQQNILSTQDKNLINRLSQTYKSYPNHLCLHHLFEQQAIKTPDALAVRFNNKDLSYQEFEQQTNQLANQLITMGIGPNKVVGVCMHRSMEMVIALYAILKAGGAYLPLDPDYPENRLQFMLDDAQAKVVLSQEPIAQGFSLKNCSVLCLDSQWEQVAKHSAAQPLSRVTVNDLAYIIYTSGSTGQPKGVMIGHQAIVNRINWMQEEFQLDASDSVLQKTPFSFDVSVWEFFWPLAVGASLVVAKPEGHKDSRYLIKTIQDNRITTLHFVPSMLNVFLDDAQVGECQGLKRVICSGEALAYEYQQRFFNCFEQTELYNLYGPTEAAVDVTAWRCERNTNSRIVPIGYAIANTQIHILDKQLQPVPVGVPGELHIGGVQLAQGYLNRPELTAEKFIPNPISQNPADRLYKTSDLARYLPDGAIEYLGRIDHQVKIRGLRIELGEIEAVLAQHPVITECVVIVREDMPGDKRIVAYVVTDQQQRPKVSELHQHLKQQLPEYMLPTAFVFLATIPLSKNGKIDRKALPMPDLVRPELEPDFIAPGTETEKALAAIWQKTLGLKQVGITDNFFELGGDSIQSIGISHQATKIGIPMNTRMIFEYPTIAELLLQSGIDTKKEIKQELEGQISKLTPIQHWFFEAEFKNSEHWNAAFMLTAWGVKHDILQTTFNTLALHHDSLRSVFSQTNGQWQNSYQSKDQVDVPIYHVELSKLSVKEQQLEIERIAKQQHSKLDFNSGQLMRVVMFDMGTQCQKILIIVHHLIIDGVSWRILFEDMNEIYQQLKEGKKIQLPAKTSTFQHWTEILSQTAAEIEDQQSYWLKIAKDNFNLNTIPEDKNSDNNQESTTRQVHTHLNLNETTQLLRHAPGALNCPINALLLGSLMNTFNSCFEFNDLLIDLQGHGREELIKNIDLSRTIGWFTSIYPMLLKSSQDGQVLEDIVLTKSILDNLPQQGIGYGMLRYLSENAVVKQNMSKIPSPQVSFNYLGRFEHQIGQSKQFEIDTLQLNNLARSPMASRPYLIEIDTISVHGKLEITWRYNQQKFHAETIQKIANTYLNKLRLVIDLSIGIKNKNETKKDFSMSGLNNKQLENFISGLEEADA